MFDGQVLKRLKPLGVYTDNNLMLSGTHTHSAPGGFLMHLLFDITTLGFIKESFDGLVEGITLVGPRRPAAPRAPLALPETRRPSVAVRAARAVLDSPGPSGPCRRNGRSVALAPRVWVLLLV